MTTDGTMVITSTMEVGNTLICKDQYDNPALRISSNSRHAAMIKAGLPVEVYYISYNDEFRITGLLPY